MGVRGLTSYLVDNRAALAQTIEFDQSDASARPATPLVVDAWGIIYQLYQETLPWAAGGEYLCFYRLTRQLVEAWRSVGLEPTCVFDGPRPAAKHSTTIKRMQRNITSARGFYTSDEPGRSQHNKFANMILPLFASHAFSYAMTSMGVACHFVSLGEADAVCVTLAGKLDAYVLGQDSDLVILPGTFRGYCPLDMMEWSSEEAPESYVGTLLPPPPQRGSTRVTLRLTAFKAEKLAEHIDLTIGQLALLSGLMGNDYVERGPAFLAVDSETCVMVIADEIKREQGDPRRTVQNLYEGYKDELDISALTNDIIASMKQYDPSLPTPCCEVFPFCGSVTTACIGSSPARSAYFALQQLGHMRGLVDAYVSSDRIYLSQILDNPWLPHPRAARANTALRATAYVILESIAGGFWRNSKTVYEYNRAGPDAAGSTAIKEPFAVWSPVRASLLPLQLRQELYLKHLGADTAGIKALPMDLQPLAAVMRFCATSAADGEKQELKWHRSEIEAVLRAALGTYGGWSSDKDTLNPEPAPTPLLTNRNAQLVAQFIGTFADAHLLAQALVLVDANDTPLPHLLPFKYICGSALHAALLGEDPPAGSNWKWSPVLRRKLNAMVDAVCEGLQRKVFARSLLSKPAQATQQVRQHVVQQTSHTSGAASRSGDWGRDLPILSLPASLGSSTAKEALVVAKLGDKPIPVVQERSLRRTSGAALARSQSPEKTFGVGGRRASDAATTWRRPGRVETDKDTDK